jgi:hypothetical protein
MWGVSSVQYVKNGDKIENKYEVISRPFQSYEEASDFRDFCKLYLKSENELGDICYFTEEIEN